MIERISGRWIVIIVVHPAGHSGIVIPQDGETGVIPHRFTTFVGSWAVSDNVAETRKELNAFNTLIPLEDTGQGNVVSVDIAVNADLQTFLHPCQASAATLSVIHLH